ncbi:uncharacterized protein LOC126815861 [Patella vulgata]|uniref:uncharacterized protein LOC126815861 n=1 Tax=Patella vulgata TaxID=6465 RepID=UPI00218038D3|nr:uncharacterized protein LOC126815861 [Patella vulgata]XP_050397815.1 uncharacterized protein LOC126815861 [Patella vulgata]
MSKLYRQPVDYVLYISCLTVVYYIIYGIMRLTPEDWNERKSNLKIINWMENKEMWRIHEKYNNPAISSDITIVTAYFDIGTFQKGMLRTFTSTKYKRWMESIKRIENPLIAFTDSQEIVEKVKELRQGVCENETQIYLVSRNDLWAFRIAPEIKDVMSQENYPKHYPNTVNENYSSCMHVKFELIAKVIVENLTDTKFISWMDIGLYRFVAWEKNKFKLTLPPDFDSTKIAYNEIKAHYSSSTIEDIITDNLVWVGGGLFVGKTDLMYVHCIDYMKSVTKMLELKWISTDQQVLYSMYLPNFPLRPRVEIQVYTTHSMDDWYHLANVLKDTHEIKTRQVKTLSFYFLQYL